MTPKCVMVVTIIMIDNIISDDNKYYHHRHSYLKTNTSIHIFKLIHKHLILLMFRHVNRPTAEFSWISWYYMQSFVKIGMECMMANITSNYQGSMLTLYLVINIQSAETIGSGIIDMIIVDIWMLIQMENNMNDHENNNNVNTNNNRS
eukprot:521133_1